MATIEVTGVPEEVHSVLMRRATAAHQSLQAYLLDRLTDETARPTLDEALARAATHRGGNVSLAEATRLVRAERDGR